MFIWLCLDTQNAWFRLNAILGEKVVRLLHERSYINEVLPCWFTNVSCSWSVFVFGSSAHPSVQHFGLEPDIFKNCRPVCYES